MNKILLLSALLLTTSATMVNDLSASSAAPSRHSRRASDCETITENRIIEARAILNKYHMKFSNAKTIHELIEYKGNFEAIIKALPSMTVTADDLTLEEALSAPTKEFSAVHEEVTAAIAELNDLYNGRCWLMLIESLNEITSTAVTNMSGQTKLEKRSIYFQYQNDISNLQNLASYVGIELYGDRANEGFVSKLKDAHERVIAASA